MRRAVLLLTLAVASQGRGQTEPATLRRIRESIRVADSILPTLRKVPVPSVDTSFANSGHYYAYLRGSKPVAIIEQWCNPKYCVVERYYFEGRSLIAVMKYRDEPGAGGARTLIAGSKAQYFYSAGKLAFRVGYDGKLRSDRFDEDAREDAEMLHESGMAYLHMTLDLRRSDEFADVRCGGDIGGAMKGRKVMGGRVVEIEYAHRGLQLNQTGGSQVSDSLFLNGWSICGREYHVLETDRVEDVLLLPPHSVRQPEFLGLCKRDGKAEPWSFVAVLDNPTSFRQGMMPRSPVDTLPYAAIFAWHIDEKAKRFIPVDVRGLRCPREGIITRDGGM